MSGRERIFDTKRDNEHISAGTHFWCHTCLVARPIDSGSPDPRYCQGCYDFLLKEADMLTERGYTKRPWWWPVRAEQATKEKIPTIPQSINMSTVKTKNFRVNTITTGTSARPLPKRGPKFAELPEILIRQWAGEGMGSKAIAARLKGEGIDVSYKTIQRRLRTF